jgi:hypothetical protein
LDRRQIHPTSSIAAFKENADPFDEYETASTAQNLTSVDTELLDALGFDVTGAQLPQLAGQVQLSSATEATAFVVATTVATFTDTSSSDTAAAFTATIDWGDGTTSAGTVVGSNGSFAVTGGHTYTDEGSYTLGVAIKQASTTVLSLGGTLVVTDADVLTAHAVTFTANPSQVFSCTVARFGDINTVNTASDFTATIDWATARRRRVR